MTGKGRDQNRTVTLVGAGLAGSLLAIYLARRGYRVEIFEQLPDMRREDVPAGRSINLALAERGIHALKRVNAYGPVLEFAIPMQGRMVHPLNGEPELQPYGQRPDEVIYAAHRARLNQVLLDLAERHEGVRIHFRHKLVGGDLNAGNLRFLDESTGAEHMVKASPVIGADGAGSPLRGLIDAAAGERSESDLLDHGYKELTIPPGPDHEFQIEPHALHIWPRGGYMLIALPNADRSFTATLFLPNEGDPGFDSLDDDKAIERFFREQFPDAVPILPELTREFRERPTGILGTVRCSQWHYRGRALVLGDAAHAIVPFHGQGMNCAFEDCEVLDDLLDAMPNSDWEEVFSTFEESRKRNTEAIATMALENYVEMRDSVRDAKFKLKKQLERELERRYPERFVPRYTMVMFRRVPYREALERGRIQDELLEQLVADTDDVEAVDFRLADRMIREKLEAIPH